MAVRSRGFAEKVLEDLVADGVTSDVAQAIAGALREALAKSPSGLLKKKPAKAKKARGSKEEATVEVDDSAVDDAGDPSQGQAILLGVKEFEHLKRIARQVAANLSEPAKARTALLEALVAEEKNLQAMALNCGLESALFGRMVTSDVLASRDASVYVAHAFTVHEAQVENDYFTVVDDLKREAGEQGSAGIFDTELASGMYYGYVVIDVPQLIANLEGENVSGAKGKDWAQLPADKRELAGRVVQHLMHLIATVSPGAKLGSTAPFEWAKLMLVEAGDWQPRTLAGAFQNALAQDGQAPIRQTAVQRLGTELGQLDAAYGAPLARRFLSVDAASLPGASQLPLAALADWVRTAITQASAEA
jgi:CRISPR system Cascade subunit CasC